VLSIFLFGAAPMQTMKTPQRKNSSSGALLVKSLLKIKFLEKTMAQTQGHWTLIEPKVFQPRMF